jgi:ribosomal protein L11 methyltransferase
MAWLSVIFEIPAACVDAVADALLDAGALAVDVADADAGTDAERALFAEPGAPPPGGWRSNRVTALFDAGVDLAAALRAAGLPQTMPLHVERVDDRDWVRATREQFTPQRVSPRLWIVPSWHAPPDPRAANVVLDPGLAFGTGTHPTTRLCLRWLAAHLRGGETVVDYGCGSGILAIAALKLGAAAAWGVDIDAQALLAARRNAVQNQVDAHFVAAADRVGRAADIVVANILAHPLIVLAPLLAGLTVHAGRVLLSGILAEQADEVRAAYRSWFDMDITEHDEGWVLLGGRRR